MVVNCINFPKCLSVSVFVCACVFPRDKVSERFGKQGSQESQVCLAGWKFTIWS